MLQRFGYDATSVPHAALSYLADSGEQHLCVMRADPVHLSVGREGVVLFDNHMLGLDTDEARELAASVQPLLGEFGAELKALSADRWYLLCDKPPNIRTCALTEVLGRDVSDRLPLGEDQIRWRQLFNEIQMTLHELPVNQARERRGLLPVNSLWFWGEGELIDATRSDYDLCISDNPIVIGLARQQDIACNSFVNCDPDPGAWIGQYEHVLMHDDRARYHQAYQNIVAWRDYLEELEQSWITTLMNAVNSGQLHSLRLITANNESICRRHHRWRFWRRPVSLTDLQPGS